MRDYFLTPHFKLSEFVRPQDPDPPAEVLDNIRMLAQRLQVLRDLLGRPMIITSGWRTEKHNREIGGAPNSYHIYGMAADVVFAGATPGYIAKQIPRWSGGLIVYPGHVHIDIRKVPYRGTGSY